MGLISVPPSKFKKLPYATRRAFWNDITRYNEFKNKAALLANPKEGMGKTDTKSLSFEVSPAYRCELVTWHLLPRLKPPLVQALDDFVIADHGLRFPNRN